MKITILTIAPEEFAGFLESHIIMRAQDLSSLELDILDIRTFADGSFRHVDDSPYGGRGGRILSRRIL